VCWTAAGPQNVYRCGDTVGRNKLEEQLGCAFGGSDSGRKEAAKCYFERQRSICVNGDGSRYQRYKTLFEAPPMEELEQQFLDIVGDSFEVRFVDTITVDELLTAIKRVIDPIAGDTTNHESGFYPAAAHLRQRPRT
jgi:hypothetical protein